MSHVCISYKRVTFDLVTLKSNHFINGSARYIHDLSLAGIYQTVLEISRSRERDVREDGQMPPASS